MRQPISIGDHITFGLAAGAALASASFAGYMWITGGSHVGEDTLSSATSHTQINSPAIQTRTRPINPSVTAGTSLPEADPITTASTRTSRSIEDQQHTDSATAGFNAPKHLIDFQLLGIYGETAIVGSMLADSQTVWPVKLGTVIPGAGTVIAILPGEPADTVLTTRGYITPLQATDR